MSKEEETCWEASRLLEEAHDSSIRMSTTSTTISQISRTTISASAPSAPAPAPAAPFPSQIPSLRWSARQSSGPLPWEIVLVLALATILSANKRPPDAAHMLPNHQAGRSVIEAERTMRCHLRDPVQGSNRHVAGRPPHQTAVWTTDGLACELASTINRRATGVMPAVAGSAQQVDSNPTIDNTMRADWSGKGMCRAVAPSTPMRRRSPKATDTNVPWRDGWMGGFLSSGGCKEPVGLLTPSGLLGSNHLRCQPPQALWSASIRSHNAPFPGDANVDDQIQRIPQAASPVLMERFADNGRCLDATNVTSANMALTISPPARSKNPVSGFRWEHLSFSALSAAS